MILCNLSTYVCDRFLGAHESFMHPIFVLKMGVTRGDERRSGNTTPALSLFVSAHSKTSRIHG
jgi:hypothetical protein